MRVLKANEMQQVLGRQYKSFYGSYNEALSSAINANLTPSTVADIERIRVGAMNDLRDTVDTIKSVLKGKGIHAHYNLIGYLDQLRSPWMTTSFSTVDAIAFP